MCILLPGYPEKEWEGTGRAETPLMLRGNVDHLLQSNHHIVARYLFT
jgi:hypothetical protein